MTKRKTFASWYAMGVFFKRVTSSGDHPDYHCPYVTTQTARMQLATFGIIILVHGLPGNSRQLQPVNRKPETLKLFPGTAGVPPARAP